MGGRFACLDTLLTPQRSRQGRAAKRAREHGRIARATALTARTA